MSILPKIYTLKDEAQDQLYIWFDQEIRKLPRKSNRQIDPFSEVLVDNDVDAFRHAFVSGVYAIEYGEQTSEIMGRLNELFNFNYSNSSNGSENMDIWNNDIGRRIARKAKTWRELFDLLKISLKNGELIIHPSDKRKYKGEKTIKRIPKTFVIKIKENGTGSNIEFLDVRRKIVMDKMSFIEAIKLGKYPGYAIRKHDSGEFPYSTRDKYSFNNLG